MTHQAAASSGALRRLVAGVAVVAAAGLAGMQFGPVFTWSALVAPVLAVCVAAVVADAVTVRLGVLRAPLALLLSLIAVFAVTYGLPSSGEVSGYFGGMVNGWLRTLDSTLPAQPDPSLYLFVPLLVIGACVVGLEFLRWLDAGVLALAPSLLVLVAAQAYRALSGPVVLIVGIAYVVLAAVVLAATRDRSAPGRRIRTSVGPAVGTLAAVVAVGLLFALVGGARPYSAPEHHAPPPLESSVDNPLTEVGQRLTDPDQAVFTDDAGPGADLWRVAVLDRYADGTWSSTARFRPLGTRLNGDPLVSAPTSTATATVRVQAPTGGWLPTTGRTVGVAGTKALVDPSTGVIRDATATGPDAGSGAEYRLTWQSVRAPDRPDFPNRLATVAAEPMALPPEATVLSKAAATATKGEPASVDAALLLEKWFRDNRFRLVGPQETGSKDAIPTGHSVPQLTKFVKDKRGTSEQFAAAYAVMAKSIGVPVRVAVGFRQPADARAGTPATVHNSDVYAWPEIPVAGYGWVPLDPAGKARSDNGGEGGGVAGALAKKRADLSKKDPNQDDKPTRQRPIASGKTTTTWHPQALFALVAVLLLPLVALTGVAVFKAVRRRRRGTGEPKERVLGAWREVRDRLRDHGHRPAPGLTANEVAASLPPDVASGAGVHVGVLARCVDEAVWSRVGASSEMATTAWSAARRVEAVLAARGLRRRLSAAVSWESLRAWR